MHLSCCPPVFLGQWKLPAERRPILLWNEAPLEKSSNVSMWSIRFFFRVHRPAAWWRRGWGIFFFRGKSSLSGTLLCSSSSGGACLQFKISGISQNKCKCERWKKSVSSWRERSRKMLQFNRSAPEFEIYCGSELFTYTGLQIFSQFAASKLCFF